MKYCPSCDKSSISLAGWLKKAQAIWKCQNCHVFLTSKRIRDLSYQEMAFILSSCFIIIAFVVLLSVAVSFLWPEKRQLAGFVDFHSVINGAMGAIGSGFIYHILYLSIGCKMIEAKGDSNG